MYFGPGELGDRLGGAKIDQALGGIESYKQSRCKKAGERRSEIGRGTNGPPGVLPTRNYRIGDKDIRGLGR